MEYLECQERRYYWSYVFPTLSLNHVAFTFWMLMLSFSTSFEHIHYSLCRAIKALLERLASMASLVGKVNEAQEDHVENQARRDIRAKLGSRDRKEAPGSLVRLEDPDNPEKRENL